MPLFTSAVRSIFTAGCQVCTVRLSSCLRPSISSRVRGLVTPSSNLGCAFSGEATLRLQVLASLCVCLGRIPCPEILYMLCAKSDLRDDLDRKQGRFVLAFK